MRRFSPFCLISQLWLCAQLMACSPTVSDSPSPVSPLETTPQPALASPAPFVYPKPTNASLPMITPTPLQQPAPLPSPTLFAYIVQSGDTISQIAERYGLSLDEVVAANPGINTQILSIGQQLQIPSRSESLQQAAPGLAELAIGPLRCIPSASGLWCLALVRNPNAQMVENVTGVISLFSSDAQPLASAEALLPLNILPAGAKLPLAAFFPSRPSGPFAARIDLASAFLLSPDDPRYLPARADNLLAKISSDGLSAQVSGRVFLPESNQPASSIWLAGLAYDADGQIVGFRRWQSPDTLIPGQSQTFTLGIYSLDGAIERVEVLVEARP